MEIIKNIDISTKLKYGMRGLRLLEQHFHCKLSKFELDFSKMGIDDIVAMVHAGLIHLDKELTHEDVLDMLDEYENINGIFSAIGDAMQDAMGDVKTEKKQNPAGKRKK